MEDHGYTVIRILGQGGSCQSRVYEVRNREGKLRVVKQLPWVSEDNRESAEREVKLLSSLRHPCIVSYLESFLVRSTPSMPSEDILCLVMGRCERDLRQECLRLRLEWELAQEQGGHAPELADGSSDCARFDEALVLSWLSQLCWGLQHLHSRKFMHRDLKPQNVLLTQGGKRALLADFGVVGQVEHTTDLRRSIVGTPAFMSPEMLTGRPYGFKTDQWALGCVLYETMALEPPFAGRCDSYAAVVNVVLHSPPLEAPPGYSEELSRTAEALLAQKPDHRPSNRELLRGSLLREPFHVFIRSLDTRALGGNRDSPLPAPAVTVRATASLSSSRQRQGSGSGLDATNLNGFTPLPGFDGFSTYTDPVAESRPDTGATAILSAALLVTGTQPSNIPSTVPTAMATPVHSARGGDRALVFPERLPYAVPSEVSSSTLSAFRGGSLSGSQLSRSIGIAGAGGSGCGSGSTRTLLGANGGSAAGSSAVGGRGGWGRSGSSSVLTLAGGGFCGGGGGCGGGGAPAPAVVAEADGPVAAVRSTAAGAGRSAVLIRTGGRCSSGVGFFAVLPADHDEGHAGGGGASEPQAESYGSDFDSLSGDSPEPTVGGRSTMGGRMSAPSGGTDMGTEHSDKFSLYSSESGVLETLEFHGSSLDDVALGREEWRFLLEEAEAMLRPETPEEAEEECWKLRNVACKTLGGAAQLDQALAFLRNRRPLGETLEADELMLQVELGDLLGDDGLQVLPFLERILELEESLHPANAGGG